MYEDITDISYVIAHLDEDFEILEFKILPLKNQSNILAEPEPVGELSVKERDFISVNPKNSTL